MLTPEQRTPANMCEDLALNAIQADQMNAERVTPRNYSPQPHPTNAGQWGWLNKEAKPCV